MLETVRPPTHTCSAKNLFAPETVGGPNGSKHRPGPCELSVPAGDCPVVTLPRLLARCFLLVLFPPLGLCWDSNPVLVHECIHLYDTTYAVGYFFPLSIPDKHFYFTKHFVIFSSTFLFVLPSLASVSGWVLICYKLPSRPGELHTVNCHGRFCAPQASTARLP